MPRLKIASYLGALLLVFASGAYVNGNRWDTKYSALELSIAETHVSAFKENLDYMQKLQDGFTTALYKFQQTQKENQDAQKLLDGTLLNLRGFTSGMRRDFADMPGRIERANQTSRSEFISTCTALFSDMAEEIGSLAEAGGEIARAADEHAANERLILDSWPRKD